MAQTRILLITTASISTNPRLLKSYIYWRKQGHQCQILAFCLNNWADGLDNALIEKYQLDIINIPATKQSFSFWLKASFLNRFLSYFKPSLLSLKSTAYASNKRSWQLIKYLKKYDFKFDHIEAHTLGALYPAFYWSKKKGKTFSFDVEDFHPEEKNTFQSVKEKERRYHLMKKLLPDAKYTTAASPMIAQETEKLLNRNIIVINNSFFAGEFLKPVVINTEQKLRLVWFSITVSYGRGLEELIEACKKLKTKVQLELIGNLDENFEAEHISPNLDFIQAKPPMPQTELHQKLKDYDVGLALEMASTDFNRNICLTNKLFAYAQSGLYVLATDTMAQKDFFQKHFILGQLCKQNQESIEAAINEVYNSLDRIRNEKLKRFEYAKQLSFEKEMEKLSLL